MKTLTGKIEFGIIKIPDVSLLFELHCGYLIMDGSEEGLRGKKRALHENSFGFIHDERLVGARIISKLSEIKPEEARNLVESKTGDTIINGKPVTTFKDYSGVSSKFYPFEITGRMSLADMHNAWVNGGIQTTKFIHISSIESLKTLFKEEEKSDYLLIELKK